MRTARRHDGEDEKDVGGAKVTTSQRRRDPTEPAEGDCAIAGQSQIGAFLHQTYSPVDYAPFLNDTNLLSQATILEANSQ